MRELNPDEKIAHELFERLKGRDISFPDAMEIVRCLSRLIHEERDSRTL